jgi:hypothetical protein
LFAEVAQFAIRHFEIPPEAAAGQAGPAGPPPTQTASQVEAATLPEEQIPTEPTG